MMQSNKKFLPIRYLNKRYLLSKLVGDGSFGEVFLASAYTDTINEIPAIPKTGIVAIKSMKNKLPSIVDYSYQKEYEFICKVPPNPYLISVYEIFIDGSSLKCHMVLEYMDQNIYQLMKSRKGNSFENRTIRNILYQIIMGIDHIHNSGFFHRDIKPENILISANPHRIQPGTIKSEYTVKLADFGLARHVSNNSTYTSYVSTRWYRSPEILLRAGVYSLPIDIWAFGTVAIEVANLCPLFPGKNEMDQIWRLIEALGNPSINSDCGEWNLAYVLAKRSNIVIPEIQGSNISDLIRKPDNKKLASMTKGCLCWDPELRYTAKDILRHEYFSTERRRYSRKRVFGKSNSDTCTTNEKETVLSLRSSNTDPEKRISLGLPTLASHTGNAPLVYSPSPLMNPPLLRQTPSPGNLACTAANLAFTNRDINSGAITPSPPKGISRILAKFAPQKTFSLEENELVITEQNRGTDQCQVYVPQFNIPDQQQYSDGMGELYSDDLGSSNILPSLDVSKPADISMNSDHIFGSFSPVGEYILEGVKDATPDGVDFRSSPTFINANFNISEQTSLSPYKNDKWRFSGNELQESFEVSQLAEQVDRMIGSKMANSQVEDIHTSKELGDSNLSTSYSNSKKNNINSSSFDAESPLYLLNLIPKRKKFLNQNKNESGTQVESSMNYIDEYILEDEAHNLGPSVLAKASQPRRTPVYRGDLAHVSVNSVSVAQQSEKRDSEEVKPELESAILRLNKFVN